MKNMMRMMMVWVVALTAAAQGVDNPIEGGATQTVTNDWQVQGVPWLFVGANTAGNSLIVTNGGTVGNEIGYIGGEAASSNNQVLVTGTGSAWNNTLEVNVGRNGSSNNLTVADGGRVDTANGYVGRNGGNNSLQVADAGSVFNASQNLYIGHTAASNNLTVANGGRVESANGTIGYWIGADGNTATVQDSVWSNSASLTVGEYGSGNRLVVGPDGRIDSPVVNIGVQTLSSNNLVSVENGGTVATESLNIRAGNNFDLNSGGRLAISTNFDASTVGFNFNAGGTLEVGGELTGMGSEIEDQRTVVLNGHRSAWEHSGDLTVGGVSSSNRVVVANGGSLQNTYGYIGGSGPWGYDANHNSVLVTGEGSSWSNSHRLYVGDYGDHNSLHISDGGVVHSYIGYIGYVTEAQRNQVLVSGSGSLWNTDGELLVGGIGSENVLNVMEGGRVASGRGYIGRHGDGNSALVSGIGSEWNSRTDLLVGEFGSSNRFMVAEGGFVGNRIGYIGSGSMADDNTAIVSGNNTIWQNHEALYLGGAKLGSSWYDGGTGNSLTVEDGGRVFVGNVDTNNLPNIGGYGGIVVGDASGSPEMVVANGSILSSDRGFVGYGVDEKGLVAVIGGGSEWIVQSGLDVGFAGAGNQLFLGDSARINNMGNGSVGFGASAHNNHAVVTGEGSVWHNNGDLMIGTEGYGNGLSINNEGHVENLNGYIGYSNTANNNAVLVSGVGSVWDNADKLYVGSQGSGNSLRIKDGALVGNSVGIIGHKVGADGNSVTVSGAGSRLINRESLYLGGSFEGANWVNGGYGSALTVKDGGFVVVGDIDTDSLGGLSVGSTSGNAKLVVANGALLDTQRQFAFIGLRSNHRGSVVVSGNGSEWVSRSQTIVGHDGSGNELSITDGGVVRDWWGTVGYAGSANGNTVLVSGEGSSWINEYDLKVGRFGSNNTLTISGGGLVENQIGYVGHGLYGNDHDTVLGNAVVVRGAGSLWENREALYFGGHKSGTTWMDSGRGNSLAVSDSGRVLVGNVDTNSIAIHGSGGVLAVGDASGRAEVIVANGSSILNDFGVIGVGDNQSGSVTVMGAGSVWDNAGDLYVGYEGSGNTLRIEDGGLVINENGYIGGTSSAVGNAVFVTDAGSEWRNANDLNISANLLYVGDGGLVMVGRDMHNRNYSTVSLDPGGHITVASNYYQDATSVLLFGVETNAVGEPLNALVSVDGTAEFETGATLQYHSNVGVLDFDVFYTNLIVEADQLIVGGVANADSLDLEAINLDGSLVDLLLWESNQNIYGLVGRKYLADSAGFAPGSQMALLSKEIDDLSLLGDSGAGAMINLLNGMSSAQQNQQITQLYEQGAPSYAHVQGITEGMGEIKKHTTRHQPATAPEGAAGPHRPDQGWQGWVKPYGVWADYSAQDGFSGYDHNIYGTLVGADRREGDALVGVAGGYVRSDIKQDDGDSSKATTGYGVLYASWGTEDWFGDLNMAYGRSSIDQLSGTAFGNAAEYDAKNYAFYFGGGKEMKLSDGRFLFTPAASLLWSYYHQAGYTEESDYLPREVSPYDRSSILSSVGATFAYQRESEIAIVKPEARLYWLHEFNAEVDAIDYTISDGGGQYHFFMPAPLADVLEAGLGISCTFHDELTLVLDVDGRFGEDYSAYAVSGRAVFEF